MKEKLAPVAPEVKMLIVALAALVIFIMYNQDIVQQEVVKTQIPLIVPIAVIILAGFLLILVANYRSHAQAQQATYTHTQAHTQAQAQNTPSVPLPETEPQAIQLEDMRDIPLEIVITTSPKNG